jgi:signal transduction histidine kinase
VAETTRINLSAAKKPVEVITRHSWPDGDDIIYSDPDRLLLILSNLASNAVRFTSQGEVEVSYEAEERAVLFRVRDTGSGIPEHKQKALFDNLLQQNYTTSTKGEGAGLGLALASALTGLLGGQLRLEKSGPDGTTLSLTIPIIPGGQPTTE